LLQRVAVPWSFSRVSVSYFLPWSAPS
jgi:hypothetical protein